MKNRLLLLLLLLGPAVSYAQDTLNVLFLGNSYTYVGNLPQVVSRMAASAGDSLNYSANALGGYTLQQHTTNATSLSLIGQGNWDYVVLQEQSQLPAFPIEQVETDVFPYAKKLDSLIRAANNCTETVYYNTWGRENGDASNCPNYPPICTYNGMDSLLQLRYRMMADSNDAIISPVAQLWHYLRDNYPSIDLYDTDGSHPNATGVYASACAFYTVLFRKDPTNITYTNIDAATAATIRQAAKTVVFDNLANWNVGKYDNVADFNYNAICEYLTFYCLNEYADSVSWNFGDGSPVSTEFIPLHIFPEEGIYPVTLTTFKCGLMDTMTINAVVIECGSVDENTNSKVKSNPNPFSDRIAISSELYSKPSNWQLINAQGQLVQSGNLNNQMLISGLGNLPNDLYLLRLQVGDKVVVKRMVKN